MQLTLTPRQEAFVRATATEVLFGGAAGGGKSHGQIADALLYALRFPGSRQLLLRRSYQELDKSLIRASLQLYPRELYTYNAAQHTGRFRNGSLLDFGYCAAEGDVYQYQSAEYDVVRFDELTHFTEFQYRYLLSRVRGTNPYPKQVKSSTNPGGVGHAWVKARFVDPAPPDTPFRGEDGCSRIYLPARLCDNAFLLSSDPGYRSRLLALPPLQRKALLEGEWNLTEGQYFSEFSYERHTCPPRALPTSWRRYRTIDYGLDRLACLWIAVDELHRCWVYRELCRSDMRISQAAAAILDATPPEEEIYATLAPPDLWARSQESGRSKALLFREHGLNFTPTANDRETGWLSIKELLAPDADGESRLTIFRSCPELIRCLPLLQSDPRRPTDTCTEPHSITHAPDALRGFAIYYSRPAASRSTSPRRVWTPDMWQDYHAADAAGRAYLRTKYGEPYET